MLGSLAKQVKDERDAAESVRSAASSAERARLEARAVENNCQEGALGVDAPSVPGATVTHWRQIQDACNLLARNPVSQNDHTRPVMLFAPPTAAEVEAALPPPIVAATVTPADTANAARGEQVLRALVNQSLLTMWMLLRCVVLVVSTTWTPLMASTKPC